MKKNPVILIGALLIILAGGFWFVKNKKVTNSAQDPQTAEINLIFLPRHRYVDEPSSLTMSKEFDVAPLVKKLEEKLSSDKLKVKVKFDSKYAVETGNFSNLKNTIVVGNQTFLFRMVRRDAPLTPLFTFSPSVVSSCTDEGVLVTLAKNSINSLKDAKDKSVMVEGYESAPFFAFNKATDDLNFNAQAIYSEISYSEDRKTLLDSLREAKVDLLFLSSRIYPEKGVFTSLGKLEDNDKIVGHNDLKVIYRTKQDIPCGFVMATEDIPVSVREKFINNLSNYMIVNENINYLSKSIGIRSFSPADLSTWQRAYNFMLSNASDSYAGKMITSKIKKSSTK